MPPSATETVQQVVVPIVEKTIGTKVEEPQNTNGSVKAAQPEGEELPKLETNHKEPLKLSGALDKFESFDVTPVIGREYANVDLVEWLRAPNSDELIRDLAITSKLCDLPRVAILPTHPMLNKRNSLSSRRRLLPLPGQAHRRAAEGARAAARRAEWQARDLEAAHPPGQQRGPRRRRQGRRDQRHLVPAGQEALLGPLRRLRLRQQAPERQESVALGHHLRARAE